MSETYLSDELKQSLYLSASTQYATGSIQGFTLDSNSTDFGLDDISACSGCAGTLGTAGTATGCLGTFGSYGSYGCG